MNTFVHTSLVVQLRSGAADRFPVLAHLSYDADDPFAVTVAFSHDGRILARWQLDREMLGDGLVRSVGVGDVRFAPEPDGPWQEVRMEFHGDAHPEAGRHHAVVFAWAPAVAAFLRQTHRVVAPGTENAGVDDFLAELFTESRPHGG
ncbi:SsgA family sporulation/cell division regulator [Streptomyces tropicalis]|uniref:SsgA family sporulation/cell division regulator n=1 Tax=Streptomyces tropicalis TaxID=3034234 RepID=A0ABT6A9G2_9ACTN|nr:SsgA family sporulation/cell division regulator [Streptomyces tropicalis]MDF3301279.1 SsgA family sporulation/cell division regulator [Streptomyces tropicalis]